VDNILGSGESIVGSCQEENHLSVGDGLAPKPRVGRRPLKYRHLIDILEDDTLYSPASIVRNGEEKGLLPVPDGDVPFSPADQERSEQAMRIRHSLARFADNHKFPRPSEGFVKLFGQAPAPGWFGATWKAALPQ